MTLMFCVYDNFRPKNKVVNHCCGLRAQNVLLGAYLPV